MTTKRFVLEIAAELLVGALVWRVVDRIFGR